MTKRLLPLLLSFAAARAWAGDAAMPAIPMPPLRQAEMPELKTAPLPTINPLNKIPERAAAIPRPVSNAKEVNGLVDLFGTEENLRIALAADRIEVSRLTPKRPPGLSVTDYVEEKPQRLSDADAASIRRILTGDESYNWDEDYECTGPFDVRLTLWQGEQSVRIDVAFAWLTLRVFRSDTEIASKNIVHGIKSLAGLLDHYVPGVISRLPSQPPEPKRGAIAAEGAAPAQTGGVKK